MGTGGSSGVDYLDMTTKYRIFKDLWEVRTILLKIQSFLSLKISRFTAFHLVITQDEGRCLLE